MKLKNKNLSLDAIDIRILNAVQTHGQVSKSTLSELVALSPSASWSRLARLKEHGLIKGYHAEIDLEKIVDLVKVVVVVSLKTHQKSDFDRFEEHISKIDQITECIATGGGSDYVMTVLSSSLNAFQALMEDLLEQEIGIDRYFTYITTRNVKSRSVDLASILNPEQS